VCLSWSMRLNAHCILLPLPTHDWLHLLILLGIHYGYQQGIYSYLVERVSWNQTRSLSLLVRIITVYDGKYMYMSLFMGLAVGVLTLIITWCKCGCILSLHSSEK